MVHVPWLILRSPAIPIPWIDLLLTCELCDINY